MKINTLTLADFRAFPGPAPQHIHLDGKNLLVYGENGAGKSSIFYALREFFSLKPSQPLSSYKNVFSDPALPCSVEVLFDDNSPAAVWTTGSHPCDGTAGGSDQRVVNGALRRARLDYRSLLDTNYLHGEKSVNLFDIAVTYLVHDFPVTVGGESKTVGELWRAVEKRWKPPGNDKTSISKINAACVNFNSGFNQAIAALNPQIQPLLSDLLAADVAVSPFSFPGVTYTPAHFINSRIISGRELILEVTYRNHVPDKPQHFFNEARLSALGLAIYLAGRLAFTPSGPDTSLKLLVLDDVLIGLDHSNRLPVLQVLCKYFQGWQIVLLTFDRGWYELARMYLPEKNWKAVEVFEGDSSIPAPKPFVRTTDMDSASAYLKSAIELLGSPNHYVEAAANYTRKAFESMLKLACENRNIKIQYKTDPKSIDTGMLLSAVESAVTENPDWAGVLPPLIERVKLYRRIVLNPYSHAPAPSIPNAEVQGAISTVEAMRVLLAKTPPAIVDALAHAKNVIALVTPTQSNIDHALSHLRALVSKELEALCQRKKVAVPFSKEYIHPHVLWKAAKLHASLTAATVLPVVSGIDAQAKWLIGTPKGVQATVQDLQQIVAVLDPSNAGCIVLSTL